MEQNIDDGKVECEICKERFKIITPGHLAKHKMTMTSYREQYPDAKITGTQFNTVMKHKDNDIFKKDLEVNRNPIIEDIISDDISPKIEAIEILDIEPVPEDRIGKQMGTILNLLRSYFPKTEKNYFIRKIDLNNNLLYEFITDYADPIAKIIFDFPNMFWHNNHHTNSFRNVRTKEDGWKIFTFHSKNPDFNKLKMELEKIF